MELPWEGQHEIILKGWAEIAAGYSWMHDRAYREYKVKNMYYAIPVIILSTLTGTANFAQQSIPEKNREFAVMIIGSLNLLSGLITTLAQFFKVNELQEAHRSSSIMFSKFSRNVSVELNLPIKNRAHDGPTFLESSRQEYNRMLEQSPIIPTGILKKFNHKFKKKTFSKPTISKLTDITIYHDPDYQAAKNEIIQLEKDKKDEIERVKEHEKTMQNLENIKSQMSFRLQDVLNNSGSVSSVPTSDDKNNNDDDDDDDSDDIDNGISSIDDSGSGTDIEKGTRGVYVPLSDSKGNIELVASEITNQVIQSASTNISELDKT